MTGDDAGRPARANGPTNPPPRSWLEIRWRQFRNAPRPVVRAVVSNLIVASVLGVLYLAYDLAVSHGADLPGGDLRTLFVALDVVLVLVVGSLATYVLVPLPRGAGRWRATLVTTLVAGATALVTPGSRARTNEHRR